jgi:hypothetical protein
MGNQHNGHFIDEKLRDLFVVIKSKAEGIEQVRDNINVKAGLRQAKSHVRSAGHAFRDCDHSLPRKVDPQHVVAPLNLHHWHVGQVEKR